MITPKNKHITDYLHYYAGLTKSPEFAVLLRGNWGSGKSWFIKTFMEERGKENFLYVSLYGVTSYAEIEDAFFEQLHPFLSSKGMKIAGKILKGAVRATLKVDFDKTKSEELSINGGLSDLNLPDYLNKLDGKIIVFDDLERCALPIYQILGYINQFVEASGLKVILVANEDEIIKADDEEGKSDNAKRYLTIKEKLVGKSFDVETDHDAALGHFIDMVDNEDCKSYFQLEENIFLIRVLFIQAGYRNLRHLKQAILDYDRFYQLLDKDVISSKKLMSHLFNLFLLISFELKKGTIHEDNLPELFSLSHLVKKDNETKSKAQTIRTKYAVFKNHGFHPLSAETWTELFKAGTIDKEKLNNELRSSFYLSDDKPDWNKLYYFENLNDDELENIYQSVKKDFIGFKFDNPYYVIHVVAIFIYLNKAELIDFKIPDIIIIGKAHLEAMKSAGSLKLDYPNNFPGDHSHGLGYASKGNPDFDLFLIFAKEIVQQNEIESYPIRAKELFRSLEIFASQFIEKIDPNRNGTTRYSQFPVFKFIEIKPFTDLYLGLSNEDKIKVSDAFEDRYKNNYAGKLDTERIWLISLKEEIEKRKTSLKGKVSGYILEKNFIPVLTTAINNIPDNPPLVEV